MKTSLQTKMILASGSPRRIEILKSLGHEFAVIPAGIDENIAAGESPADHVLRLSRAKATYVAAKYPDSLVIGADTIVVLADEILGKPKSPSDAIQMLNRLSGKRHAVYTGLALVYVSRKINMANYDLTYVMFNDLDPSAIENYVASGEPLDKAGAYGIQGMGSFLVKNYDGELDTVIGLPSKLFEKLLRESGI